MLREHRARWGLGICGVRRTRSMGVEGGQVSQELFNPTARLASAWNFVVHTTGLGITSLDGEQNLTAIAQAHHGVYRRVEVPKLRTR
jgi:hypothetical protein